MPPAQQPVRAAEWGDLFGTAVLDIHRFTRSSARLELRPDPMVAARAADLAARETQCCSFFTFNQIATGGKLTLEIGVLTEQIAALDALLGLASATNTRVT